MPTAVPRPSPARTTGTYRAVLAVPGAAAFFAVACAGRIGIAMTGLGIIWLVHAQTGAYGAAGVVTGAFAVAEATIGPHVARFVDRYGQTRVLPPAVAVHALAVAALVATALLRAPVWASAVAGVLAGASIPQLGALAQTRWAALLGTGALLPAAFALEASANGLSFLVGPAVVGAASSVVSPVAGTVLAATLVVGSGLVLAALRRTAPPVAVTPAGHSPARGLLRPAFAMLVVVGLALGGYFGAMQVSVTAYAVGHGAARLAGPLYSITSAASLAAGWLYARRPRRRAPAVELAVAVTGLAAASVPLLFAGSVGALAAALVAPGLGIAPIMALTGLITQANVDRSVLTQALVWLNSASAAGVAASAAVAGHLVDACGTRCGFGVAVALTAAAAAAVWAGRGALRGPSHPG
ncbi:MAG TPA: MFS transporter [Streptosporangiales bacterium]